MKHDTPEHLPIPPPQAVGKVNVLPRPPKADVIAPHPPLVPHRAEDGLLAELVLKVVHRLVERLAADQLPPQEDVQLAGQRLLLL